MTLLKILKKNKNTNSLIDKINKELHLEYTTKDKILETLLDVLNKNHLELKNQIKSEIDIREGFEYIFNIDNRLNRLKQYFKYNLDKICIATDENHIRLEPFIALRNMTAKGVKGTEMMLKHYNADKYLYNFDPYIVKECSQIFDLQNLEWIKEQIELEQQKLTPNSPTPIEDEQTNKIGASQKTRIAVLNEIGFFELEKIKDITLEQQGKFISELLNMNIDNAKDYIGNRFDKDINNGNKKSPYNKTANKKTSEILSLINLTLK